MRNKMIHDTADVVILHCDSPDQAYEKVNRIIDLLGRERIVALLKNKKVLLKPNLCIDYPPERGATTHPAVVEAMIRIVRDHGGTVTVGDGPIIGVRGKIFRITGMEALCEMYGVKLVNFNNGRGRPLRIDNPLVWEEALIAEEYFHADTVVNLALFKSNSAYWLSGALKNMKGLLVAKEKHEAHRKGVPACVADLNRMVRQDLVIMDGLIGMMGDGPAAGEAANARVILGGFDPVAVDSAAATLMRFPVKKIPMIALAERSGVGTSEFHVLGDPVKSFNLNFKKPTVSKNRFLSFLFKYFEKAAFNMIRSRTRLVIDEKKCTLCRRCQEACPFDAVRYKDKRIHMDMKACDFCLCCMEACGQNAITLKGLLAKTDAFMKN